MLRFRWEMGNAKIKFAFSPKARALSSNAGISYF